VNNRGEEPVCKRGGLVIIDDVDIYDHANHYIDLEGVVDVNRFRDQLAGCLALSTLDTSGHGHSYFSPQADMLRSPYMYRFG
jgi:hypothetical protein